MQRQLFDPPAGPQPKYHDLAPTIRRDAAPPPANTTLDARTNERIAFSEVKRREFRDDAAEPATEDVGGPVQRVSGAGSGQVRFGNEAGDSEAFPMDGRAISFGPFRLLAARQLLREGDEPVWLGSRAFDILAALVERAGEVVGKEELVARAWPGTFVEEANLKIQVSALRRALGDGQGGHRYIVTVPGRGYNFVAPVSLEEPPQAPLPPTIASADAHNLPLAVTRMIGRDETVAALVSRLSRQHLVTIVGPGGIGKTTVALAVAERIIASYEHGVWLVDLAPLGDPLLVPSTVATVLGLEVRSDDPMPWMVAFLADKRMLLVLDSCEHVVEAAADLVAEVLRGAPGVRALATSREPPRGGGERPHRLP